MLRIAGIALAATFLSLAFVFAVGCSHVTGPAVVAVSGVVDCAKKSTRDVALRNLDDGASALVSDDWRGELKKLVTRIGGDALACVLDKLRADGKRYMGDDDVVALERKKANRAEDWLIENRVVFATYADAGAP